MATKEMIHVYENSQLTSEHFAEDALTAAYVAGLAALRSQQNHTELEPREITTEQPACVFYCNRKCNLDWDWCAEGPGCPRELDAEKAMRLLTPPPNEALTMEEVRE